MGFCKFPNLSDTLATLPGVLSGSHLVEDLHRIGTPYFLTIVEHIQGDAVVDMLPGANAIDRLLHLTVAAVASLHGVGS